jgi:DNA mismatch repair protein MutS2
MAGAFAESALAAIEFPAALDLISRYAVTPLGAARVRALSPSSDEPLVRRELDRVAGFLSRLEAGDDLESVPYTDPTAALERLRLAGGVLEGAELVAVRSLAAAARAAGAKLRRAARAAGSLGEWCAPPLPAELEKQLDRSLEDDGRLKDAASKELARVRRELVEARRRLVARLERILAALPARHKPAEAAVTLRGGRYVVPVRSGGRSRVGGIVHDESASHATWFVEPAETVDDGNRLRSLEVEEAREVQRILRRLTELLRPNADLLAANLEMLVAMDAAYARARWAQAHGAAPPELASDTEGLAIVGAVHPLLPGPAAAVRFDLVMEPGECVVVVSGPNTGGKTVLLKAVGLVTALAQSGVLPPVRAGTRLPVFGALYADIGDRQSIRESLSTFSAHLAELRAVLESADARSLVLLDEVGAGTDPAEGAALAAAVLRDLARRRALTLASTHLGALKELAGREPGIVNAALEFDAATLAPSYRFSKGTPGRSYGLAIARRLGLPPAVLAEAEAALPSDSRRLDATLAAAETRGQELEREAARLKDRKDALDARASELERLRLALEAEQAELGARVKQLERELKSARRETLLEARAEVERAIALAREGREKDARRTLEAAIRELSAGPVEARDGAGDAAEAGATAATLEPGRRVRIRSLGLVGEIESVRGEDVAVMVRGRRVRVPAADLAGA